MSTLLIRLSALGDILLTLPAVQALAAARPEEQIVFLCDAPYAPLLEGQPGIAQVVVWPKDVRGRPAAVSEMIARFGATRFETVIDLHHKVRTIRLARRLARARGVRSLTLRGRTPLQALLALLGHDPPRRAPHATRLAFEPLSALGIAPPPGEGALPIPWRIPSLASGTEPLRSLRAARGRLLRIGIAPSTRWPTKTWPEERWLLLARGVLDLDAAGADDARLLLVGGADDMALHTRLEAALPPGRVASSAHLDLPGLGAALAGLDLLVTGDSGPAHLAAAVGCKVIALFGPTAPERWAPGPDATILRQDLFCQPCSNHGALRCPLGHHACMRELSPEVVLQAVRAHLQGVAGDAPSGSDS